MVGAMAIMATSFKKTYASMLGSRTVIFSSAAGRCQPAPPLETAGHSQASLAQSDPFSWVLVCTRFCLCPTIEPPATLVPLYSHPGDNPQTGEQLYQSSSHTVAKVLGPTTDFPTWGSSKVTENPQGI